MDRSPFTTPRHIMASMADVPDIALLTVPNVEILEVGEDWDTSTGLFTWDEGDLQSAVESQADPAVRTPVIKLGHVDPRFDGQPSFGRLANLTITNNGQTLLADLVGVPAWLAKIMPSAYPRRSIEGWFDKTSKTGNKWPFTLTGMALLGDAYPAITTLEDIPMLYGEDVPPLVPASDTNEVLASRETDNGTYILAVRGGDGAVKWRSRRNADDSNNGVTSTTEVSAAMPRVMAGVSADDVRRAYYDSLNSDQYWWWIRQLRISPAELIVDDDDGQLYRVTYSIDAANDTVVFGEAQPVKEEYVDVAAAASRGEAISVLATWNDRTAAGNPKTKGSLQTPVVAATITGDGTESEVRNVNLSDEALRALGLEPGATDDEINAAVVSKTTAPATTDTPAAGEVTPPTTDATTPTGATTTTPPATETTTTETPKAPEGFVLVDAATLAQMQQGVAAASGLVERERIAERDRTIADAVRAGKFPRSRVEHYTKSWDVDPEGTKEILASLAPGLIPVEEKGHEGGETDVPVGEAYPESWKPAVAAANRGIGTKIKVVAD